MGYYSDFKNQAVSTPSIQGTTTLSNITGTAVDLAGKYGAMVLFTFGSSPSTIGTGVYAPWIHESSDASTWSTAAAADVTSTKHGSLVGTTSVAATGASYLMGYTGSKRYIRAFVQSGGAFLGGTAVGGTVTVPVSATVVSFVSGIVPNTGT